MDYKKMTAPCGLNCFGCPIHLAENNEELRKGISAKYGIPEDKVACEGCKPLEGRCLILTAIKGEDQCKVYECAASKKIDFCHECPDFPCDLFHPCADKANEAPHNLKVFNLCQIKKMGINEWAEKKANRSFAAYFNKKF